MSTGDGEEEGQASDSAYPMTLVSPYGETVLEARPQDVIPVSDVDTDIAIALGVQPQSIPKYGEYPLNEYTLERIEELGWEVPPTWDAGDGVNFDALIEQEPDAILGVSAWSLDTDWEQLSMIAPVIALPEADDYGQMPWPERTRIAATALGIPEKAEEVIDDVDAQIEEAAAAHPEWAGQTITYVVIHPDQITYSSFEGSDVDLLTKLGFVLPEEAAQFDEENTSVAKENLDLIDADVLMVAYPFGDEGLVSRDQLETDPLFQSVPAVQDGRYVVLGDDIASPLAYPGPISTPFVLERLVPLLESVTG